jgi:hypothetical protein
LMKREVLSFSASVGVEQQCNRWAPHTSPVAIIKKPHGMGEHAAR